MLGILLLILKIIGLVLLGMVCLLLALFLLVLFIPVPYRLQAEFGDRFTWRLRVFGIQVFPKKEKAGRKRRRQKKIKAKTDAPPGEGDAQKLPDTEQLPARQEDTEVKHSGETKEDSGVKHSGEAREDSEVKHSGEVREDSEVKHSGETREDSEVKHSGGTKEDSHGDETAGRQKAEKRGVKRFGKKKFKKGQSRDRKSETKKADKRKSKDRKFGRGKPGKKKTDKDKRKKKSLDLEMLRAKWELFRTEFKDEGNRRAVGHGFSEVAYILRHFGPRRVKADLIYSLADPANTGYAAAALSLCPVVYKKGCGITPDFESEKLYAKGWMDASGHVRLIHPVCSGLRLLIDKDIRAIIKKVRKLK